MKSLIYISIFVMLTACNYSDTILNKRIQKETISEKNKAVIDYTTTVTNSKKTKLSVIVLPPYDEIANEGISPNLQEYIETALLKDTSLTLLKFHYRHLMNVPYQNVFDKKYCKPITDNTKADIIVLSKLEQNTRTGKMTTDKWSFQIRIYNVKSDKQINSTLTGYKLTNNEIQNVLSERQNYLISEIKNYR